MTISYEEALSTLSSMFSSQGYTSQQLDAVLRHYGGHMENCVEAILLHGDGSPDELIRKLPSLSATAAPAAAAAAGSSSGGNGSHDIDADEELARQLAAEDRQQQSSNNYARTTQNNARAAAVRRQQLQEQRRPMASTVTAGSPSRRGGGNNNNAPQQQTKGRGTLTTLPTDFLRIPGRNYSTTTDNITNNNGSTAAATTSTSGANGMTDEQLARMLQDELFQEELRNNPEFSHLGNYHGSNSRRSQLDNNNYGSSRSQQGQYGQGQQGPDIFDKLSELGDAARQRFQAFAAGWNNAQGSNANTNSGGGGLFGLGGAGAVGGGSPNNRGGNERRGLLSGELDMDEDEEEMDFIGGGAGRDVELKSVGRSGDKKTD
jgi:ribosomal protein L12E/L44/L45/RPP1/RPP2